MERLSRVRVGIIFLIGLLSVIVLLPGPSVADARAVSEGEATSGGFDCAGVTQIPQVECEALVTFYYATGGDGWYEDEGWLVTNTPCEWYGITCEAGHVTGLNLPFDTNLVGSFPHELADLSQLKVLVLWSGGSGEWGLSGVIPPELGTLSHLETFELGHNGELNIPPEVGNLSSLKSLYISEWAIPADPIDLTDLLHLDGCATIPPELGNLANLESLTIVWSVCDTIPPELGNLSNLQVLNLSDNVFDGGPIPPELGNLANLTYLDLSWPLPFCPAMGPGPLSGPLPPELGNLSNLQFFRIYCQSVSGPIPMTFVNLLDLHTFIFWSWGDEVLCEPPDPAFQAWIDAVPSVHSTGILCEPTSQQLYLPLVVR